MGCGYAARLTAVVDAGGEIAQPIVVVRLSDGRAHALRTTAITTTSLTSVVGLTCDEVFIRGNERPQGGNASRPNIFRIRLDSLGSDRLLPEPKDAGN